MAAAVHLRELASVPLFSRAEDKVRDRRICVLCFAFSCRICPTIPLLDWRSKDPDDWENAANAALVSRVESYGGSCAQSLSQVEVQYGTVPPSAFYSTFQIYKV
jgi:hypothetical protein